MTKRAILALFLDHADGQFSILELADAAEAFVDIANDNFEEKAPNHSVRLGAPKYHAQPVDMAMADGGWRVLGVENRIGNTSNDDLVSTQQAAAAKRKIERIL